MVRDLFVPRDDEEVLARLHPTNQVLDVPGEVEVEEEDVGIQDRDLKKTPTIYCESAMNFLEVDID